MHPLIAELIQSNIRACDSVYCILVSPLLLETDQHKLVDRILVVDVSEETQVARALDRDGGDPAIIKAIIASQTGRKMRLGRADDIILNEQSAEALRLLVADLHNQYLQLAGNQ